jgi:hypothetical protein
LEFLTPKKNKAFVSYSISGIPTDEMGLMPLFIGYTVKDHVIIQPHLKDDAGLLLHELTHVDQWHDYCYYNFRYKKFKKFRMKMEAEAFAAQLAGNKNDEKLKSYANELSTKYNINSSLEVCENLIKKFYGGGYA